MPTNAQYGVLAFFGFGEFYRLLVNYDLGLWKFKNDAIPGSYIFQDFYEMPDGLEFSYLTQVNVLSSSNNLNDTIELSLIHI